QIGRRHPVQGHRNGDGATGGAGGGYGDGADVLTHRERGAVDRNLHTGWGNAGSRSDAEPAGTVQHGGGGGVTQGGGAAANSDALRQRGRAARRLGERESGGGSGEGPGRDAELHGDRGRTVSRAWRCHLDGAVVGDSSGQLGTVDADREGAAAGGVAAGRGDGQPGHGVIAVGNGGVI